MASIYNKLNTLIDTDRTYNVFGKKMSGSKFLDFASMGAGVVSGLSDAIANRSIVNADNIQNSNSVQSKLYENTIGGLFDGDRGIVSDIYAQQYNVEDADDFNMNQLQRNVNKINAINGTGAIVGDIISGAAKGAQIGMNPFTIAAGAGYGAIKGIGNIIKGNDLADQANNTIDIVNKDTIQNLGNAMINKDINSVRNMLMNSYATGGQMNNINNGVNVFDGPSHADNQTLPGIPQGINQEDGLPNFVEGGEVEYDDYVWSAEKKAKEEFLEQAGFSEKEINEFKDKPYADNAKSIQKESENRPNDQISKRTMDARFGKLRTAQEMQNLYDQQKEMAKMINNLPVEQRAALAEQMLQPIEYNGIEDDSQMFANGGKIHIAKNKRGTFTAAATKHGMGVQEFARHVLAHPEKYSGKMRKKANFARNASRWHSGQYGFDENTGELLTEEIPLSELQSIIANNSINRMPLLYDMNVNGNPKLTSRIQSVAPTFDVDIDDNRLSVRDYIDNPLRKAPIVGAAAGFAKAALQPVDYRLGNAERNIAQMYTPVEAETISELPAAKFADVNTPVNNIIAQINASRRAASQTNRNATAANIIPIDNQGLNAIANARYNAEQMNYQRLMDVAKANSEIQRFNAQSKMATAERNAAIRAQKAQALTNAAIADDAARSAWSQAYHDNSTNFYNQIGNLGRENANWAWYDFLNSKGYFDNRMFDNNKSNENKSNKNISSADKQKMLDALILAGVDTNHINTTEDLINAYGRHIGENIFKV